MILLNQVNFYLATKSKILCPDLDVDLIDKKTKTYVKTACFMRGEKMVDKIQDDWYTNCKSYGMQLFVIDTAKTQTLFFNAMANNFPYYWQFAIDGKRSGKNWYYYSSGSQTAAFKGLIWYISKNTPSGYDCLIADALMAVDGEDCTRPMSAACEYVK